MTKRKNILLCLLLLTVSGAVKAAEGKSPAIQAFELRMNGQVDKAREILEKEVKEEPNDAVVWFELSRVYFYICPKTLDMAPAQEAIEKAIELDSANARYYCWAGKVAAYDGILKSRDFWGRLAMGGQFKKSIKFLEKAVKLKPDYHDARRELIGYYERLPWYLGGSKSKAKKHEEKLVELGASLDEVHDANMTLLYDGLEAIRDKEYDVAEQKVRQYLDTKPVVPMQGYALMQLGRIYWLQGKKTEAKDFGKQADKLDEYPWPATAPPAKELFTTP